MFILSTGNVNKINDLINIFIFQKIKLLANQ